jgi:hypothetical protein
MKRLTLCVISMLFIRNAVVADRVLSSDEINTILSILTQNSVQTWLPAGTIQARHLEYYEAEKSVYESNETMRFNGSRFCWEISLVSVGSEDKESSGKRVIDANLLETNREKVFCWNGDTYTRYYKSSNHAVIESQGAQAPFGTYGPFSAGIIPWGYGIFTLQNLSQYTCTGSEVWVEGQNQIHLHITDERSSPVLQMSFVLDPNKNYAMISYLLQDPQLSGIEQKYGQYIQVDNRWIPTVITIERFLKTPQGRKVASYEDWRFETIKSDVPAAAELSVKLENGTFVESHSLGKKSLMYYVNDQKDIKSLLDERAAFLSYSAPVQESCAAAAAQLAVRQFSRSFSAEQMEALVAQQNNKMTSLYLLKEKLEESGLYCAAVETTLESLRGIKNSTIILHLSSSNHYVILDHIDDKDVWTIDLTSRKIYWKTPAQQFLQEWKQGTALIVSDNPSNLSNNEGTLLPPLTQQQIMGGNVAGYSCTELLQDDDRQLCSDPVGWLCGGRYYRFWERYGCREDPNGGTCVGQAMPGHNYTHCLTNFEHIGWCKTSGIWYERSIRACR